MAGFKLGANGFGLYAAILRGAHTIPGALDNIAARIATADLRREVLVALQVELEAELTDLSKREAQLLKKLS